MSVRTTADEHISKAKEHINAAIHELNEIIVNQCHGHDDYRESYHDKLTDAFNKLLKMRKDLG